MKKSAFFFMLCIWFQFMHCYEYKTQGLPILRDVRKDVILRPVKRLKSITTRHRSYTYSYDSTGRLKHMEMVDLDSKTPTPVKETYEYNHRGRIVKSTSPLYKQFYAYDANNRLIQHTRLDNAGKRDSVIFGYDDETIIGVWKNVKYFYVNNCLSKIYNGDHTCRKGEEKGITAYYSYRTTVDKAYASILKNYDVLTLADFSTTNKWHFSTSELALYERRASNCSFIPVTFERIYDADHYPIKLRIMAITGAVAEPEVSYSYYEK